MANTNAFPFDAVLSDGVYDREFTSDDFASYFRKIMSNGVFVGVGNALEVIADNNSMFLTVKDGATFINGRVREWTAEQEIRLANSDASFNRIDAVVVRLDLINRNITLEVLQGSPSAVPTAPTLTQTEDVFELCLAEVSVKTGVIALTSADITDKRGTSLCGYVSSMVGEDVADALGAFLYGTSEDEIESMLDDILGV